MGLHLYTAATMNGWKPVILLEELGEPYELTHVNLGKQEQKGPDYMRLNPNGRIPTLVDDGFSVFESGAILWYLAEKFDRFLPRGTRDRSTTLQWLMFQMAGVGPMMGQAMYFQRIAEPKGHREPFSIHRYVKESRRLLEVLDRRLSEAHYLAGSEYTIADMAMFPWARSHVWAKVSVEGLDHLQRWFEELEKRRAIQKALTIPKSNPAFFGEGDMERATKENAARF